MSVSLVCEFKLNGGVNGTKTYHWRSLLGVQSRRLWIEACRWGFVFAIAAIVVDKSHCSRDVPFWYGSGCWCWCYWCRRCVGVWELQLHLPCQAQAACCPSAPTASTPSPPPSNISHPSKCHSLRSHRTPTEQLQLMACVSTPSTRPCSAPEPTPGSLLKPRL